MVTESSLLMRVGEKLLDGFISVIILLVVLWFAKKFFEKFFDIFIDNVNDNREEYQSTLKVKEEQVLSIISSKESIISKVTDGFTETSKTILSEQTKQMQLLINDNRIGINESTEERKSKDLEISKSYKDNILSMDKSQSFFQSLFDELRKDKENEKDALGKMMWEMEQRITSKLPNYEKR